MYYLHVCKAKAGLLINYIVLNMQSNQILRGSSYKKLQ